MADPEQGDERKPLKDNTKIEFKRKDVARNDHAPTGAKGTQNLTPEAGLGHQQRSQTRQTAKPVAQEQQKTDNRPLAAKTGDREVDAHYGKDHRLVDPDKLSGKGEKGKDATNEKSAGPSKPSAQDIFNKMARDRSRDKDRGL